MSVSPAGRVLCPQCGVNNFATQAACWRCGASLAGGGATVSAPGRPAAAPGGDAPRAAGTAYRPVASIDPAVATWSAWILAFLFPFVAVPVGLVFLMLDDRRKADIGKITLIAGTIFSLLHLLATWAMLQPVIGVVRTLGGLSNRTSGASTGLGGQDPNASVPPLNLPGIPQTTPSIPFPKP